MKKFVILLLAAFLTSAAVPAFSAEAMKSTKDECLLSSKDCKTAADSIQQKIKKLQAEIKKGTKVYSADEIKKLDAKLKEANELLDGLLKH